MFFSGRRALLGTEWDSYFLVPGNLEFPLVCFRVFCVPGVFRILGLHLGDHCLGSENFFPFRAFLNRTSLFQSQPPNPVTSGVQVSYHIGITLSGYNIALGPGFVNRF